jgi:hypothetical protein
MRFSGQPSGFSRDFLRINEPGRAISGATLHPSVAAVIVKEWLTPKVGFEECDMGSRPVSNPAMRNVLGARTGHGTHTDCTGCALPYH